ncbi:NAD(P)/FAD-dependent oxidoreductase [Streptomyces albipurpureus]|uniref:NAD(P)/FAD-dependent oxidoreductase n=1 Tax=Streptomyces albipurpureus TaxID=2897419 RepID=A0ABT0UI79_9ACTN|nr:FAD/NAD(P)-binding oxidoreductase [Streptomyces sp. CWNU-1]MCM2388154.1 NAD(P)/FAD-dependent oxidoreductase [Streptomyces sp. CWNU-1]
MVGTDTRTIVVAGGSLAGHTVVTELDRRGFTGEVVWVRGDESVSPYSKPALSKEFMQGKLTAGDISLPAPPADGSRLRVIDGTLCARLDADADRVLVGDEWISFDALFICTGMRARVPAHFTGLPGVHSLRTLADAAAIRAQLDSRPRAVVVGAGLIGSETAASLRSLGLPVELVVQGRLPMEAVVGEELGRFCLERHHSHGVTTRLSATVTELSAGRAGGPITVAFDDGATTEAGLVVLGLGATTACGWLEGSGLDLSDGVLCDASLRARPSVFAAGDIANWPNPVFGGRMRVEHWSNASAQARHAVESWSADQEGRRRPAFADVPYFWSDQYGLKYQMVGHARGHDEVRVESAGGDGARPLVTYYRDGRLVAAAGVNATRAVMRMKSRIHCPDREPGPGDGPLPSGRPTRTAVTSPHVPGREKTT